MRIIKRKTKVLEPISWVNFITNYPQFESPALIKFCREHAVLKNIILRLPSVCPFQRTYDLEILGRSILICHIPALCKLNPFFNLFIQVKIAEFSSVSFEKLMVTVPSFKVKK